MDPSHSAHSIRTLDQLQELFGPVGEASSRKELDFILYQEGIEVTGFEVPKVRFSDHLPLICDFEVALTQKNEGSEDDDD